MLFLTRSLVVLLSFNIICFANAQDGKIIMTNSVEVDENRYKDFKGSPFLFPENVPLEMVARDGSLFKDLIGNYNGHEEVIEIIVDDKMISLDELWYSIIKFYPENDGDKEVIMIKGGHPKYPDKFVIQLYRGEKYTLLKEFDVRVSENKVQDVGKTVTFKKFMHIPIYFLIMEDEVERVKLNKKNLLNQLGKDKAKEQLIKKHKLHLKKEEDVIKFLKLLDAAG